MYMGLKRAYFAVGTYADNTEPTYASGAEIGKAMSGNMSMTYDSATGYGNGAVVCTANGVTGGTMTYEVTGMSDSGKKLVFGFTETDGVLVETDASSPEGGFAFYRVLMDDEGAVKYECWHILRVRLHMSAQDMQQRTESTNFVGLPIEGQILAVVVNNVTMYRKSKTVDTEAAAIAWCKGQLSIT